MNEDGIINSDLRGDLAGHVLYFFERWKWSNPCSLIKVNNYWKPIRQTAEEAFIDINILLASFNFSMSLKINLIFKRFVNYI